MDKNLFNKEEEQKLERTMMHSSVNIFKKRNTMILKEEAKNILKRSSSVLLTIPSNFVPKLKPIQDNICPSPIILDQKCPPELPENNEIEKMDLFPPFNLHVNEKPIKTIYSKKTILKNVKIINIEEENHETEAISDGEDRSLKITLFNSSSSSDNSKNLENNDEEKFQKEINLLKNIKTIREKMTIIRKYSIRENVLDDSNIDNSYTKSKFSENKNIYQQKFISKVRKNKNMYDNPLKFNKNRTKSIEIQPRYVSTILGFLEKNKSSNSFKSNDK